MEWFRTWIYGICAAAVLVSAAKSLAPKNSAGKLVGIVGALILVCALIAPFKSLDAQDISRYSGRYGAETADLAEKLEEENKKIQADIIEDKLSAYILERAEGMGISCSDSRVEVGENDRGQLYLKSVNIEFDKSVSAEKRREFKEVIEREYAIPCS